MKIFFFPQNLCLIKKKKKKWCHRKKMKKKKIYNIPKTLHQERPVAPRSVQTQVFFDLYPILDQTAAGGRIGNRRMKMMIPSEE